MHFVWADIGHCVFGFKDGDEYWYLENAWDKMKGDNKPGLYGPFESEDSLKDYFGKIYTRAHEKDTDEPVSVKTYEDYLQEGLLSESVKFIYFK